MDNGSLSINGAAGIRRTISFNMLVAEDTNNLTNLNNLISMNKKCKVYIGIKNYLIQYKNYGEIIWFPLGLYIISKASISVQTNSVQISI